MRTFLVSLFTTSAVCAALALASLFIVTPRPSDYVIAAAAAGVTLALYALTRWYLTRYGRFGLLKPRLYAKRRSPKERKAQTTFWAGAVVMDGMTAISNARRGQGLSIENRVHKELGQIPALGAGKKDRTEEELTSYSLLYDFAEPGNPVRGAPPLDLLRPVADEAVFWDLRKKVDEWHEEAAKAQAKSQDRHADELAWRAHVGDTDQSHLLKNGWIAFLETLPGPDIHLWHGIATDFHGMDDSRLEAAFWIVSQDICDRATVSDFIAGYIYHRLDIIEGDGCAPDPRLEHLRVIIEAFNMGHYPYHSIPADIHVAAELDEDVLGSILARYERITGCAPLPRPTGILTADVPPTDPGDRGYASAYAFWDEAGLHLRYPGKGWRQAG